VDLVLLDWTRMGKSYCLAGAVAREDRYWVVRPLPAWHRTAPVRNVGWGPEAVDGHSRWEVFELLEGRPAPPQPPHLEDAWVSRLKPSGRLATPAQRRAVLQATLTAPGQDLFGSPLVTTRSTAYLAPGTGCRSLTSVLVPAGGVTFSASWREGVPEPDYRVKLAVPGLEGRALAVKDHFLLRRAEMASTDLERRVQEMTLAVGQMGDPVLVRLGLSRAFQPTAGRTQGVCYLMADGFFSFTDPQP
jgi:hypothetical protein